MTERSFASPSDTISETREEAATRCMLVILSFLNERGIAISDRTAFIAQRFAQFWIDPASHNTAFSALIRLQAETQQCALQLQSYAPAEQAVQHEQSVLSSITWTVVTRTELDDIFSLFHLLAQKLCLRYKWERNGNQITLSLARDSVQNDDDWQQGSYNDKNDGYSRDRASARRDERIV